MIKITNVSKKYGKKEIINNMNLEIPSGKIVGFIGPNGSGKSTTIKMMTGITNITSGNITINEKDITKNPIEAKREFGLVPDSPDMFLQFKVLEYFNFIADIYGISKEDREKRIKEYSNKFEIEKYLQEQINDLSHGTRQKVIVIGVLIQNPKVWILDEPLTGLDPNAAYVLKELMKEHAKKGNTVFFSTHVLEVAQKLCDEIIILKDGNVLYQGGYDKLISKYVKDNEEVDLEKLFINLTKNNSKEVK